MNKPIILDASAVLAYLQGEPGWEQVDDCLRSHSRCLVPAANQAEIIAKALDRGMGAEEIRTVLGSLGYQVIEHPAQDGEQAGWLRATTRRSGLSLGDRLCLATALRLQASIFTADRPWLEFAAELQLDIHCVRPGSH